MKEYKNILTDISENICTITLNRPDKLNAYTNEMLDEVLDALDYCDAEDDVRIIIVTGQGRAFCAGADLSGGAGTFDYAGDSVHSQAGESPVLEDGTVDFSHPNSQDGGGKLACRIFELNKPIIAAINGPAFGVGATMTLACDFRMMSVKAKYGFPFARLGVVPEGSSSWFLPRLVGISKALEWTMGARVVEAEEAYGAGLVRSVHEPETLLTEAREFATSLIQHTAPVSVTMTRKMMWAMLGADHPMEANKLDTKAIWSRGVSADAAEGVSAFLEKRDANFTCKVSTDFEPLSPWMDRRPYSEKE